VCVVLVVFGVSLYPNVDVETSAAESTNISGPDRETWQATIDESCNLEKLGLFETELFCLPAINY